MAKRRLYDPYIEVLAEFNRRTVRYVVVGMSGINYYASKARETFATQDFDIFVKPTIENVKRAVSIFEKLNYSLMADKEKLRESSIRKTVRCRKTILATDPYGIAFELILSISAYTFNQMEEDATIFNVEKIPIKVAKLNKLLISKKAAGREKDRVFLKRYEILLKEISEDKDR